MGSKTFAQLRTEVGRLGHWNTSSATTDSYASATGAAEAGLRAIDRLVTQGANFPWTLDDTQFYTLASALTDGYKLAVPARLLRVKGKEFRYGTAGDSYLLWLDSVSDIDAILEPSWRTTSGSKGVPRFVTRSAGSFLIAPQPSTDHLAAFPYLYYGFYQREDAADTTLLIPDELFDAVVVASLAHYLKQKDDTDLSYYRNEWQRVWEPALKNWSGVSGVNDRMAGARLADDGEGMRGYGD